MDISLIISIFGTILTAIGTIVTLVHSKRVKKIKKEIMDEVNRVNLVEVYDNLKSIQNDTRKLLFPSSQASRGSKPEDTISTIQKNIDESLSIIVLDEKDNDVRNKLILTQKNFHSFIRANTDKYKKQHLDEFHKALQETVAIVKTKTNNLLGK